MNILKKQAAEAALSFVEDHQIIGVGTGSTIKYFIEGLRNIKHKIEGCIASSLQTAKLLKDANIPLIDLNAISELPIYVDGADEVNHRFEMIKGGGGALTREKIIATVSQQFICIVDESKVVNHLGTFPVAVEVIELARSYVARELVKMGGDPVYREHFLSDNGNRILDVYNLSFENPASLETEIKLIPGVIDNGIFSKRKADRVIIGTPQGITML